MNVGQLKQLLKSTGLEDEALVLIETAAQAEGVPGRGHPGDGQHRLRR